MSLIYFINQAQLSEAHLSGLNCRVTRELSPCARHRSTYRLTCLGRIDHTKRNGTLFSLFCSLSLLPSLTNHFGECRSSYFPSECMAIIEEVPCFLQNNLYQNRIIRFLLECSRSVASGIVYSWHRRFSQSVRDESNKSKLR